MENDIRIRMRLEWRYPCKAIVGGFRVRFNLKYGEEVG